MIRYVASFPGNLSPDAAISAQLRDVETRRETVDVVMANGGTLIDMRPLPRPRAAFLRRARSRAR